MCVKYPSHLVFNQNHRISFPYTTHFVFAIINETNKHNIVHNCSLCVNDFLYTGTYRGLRTAGLLC